MSSLSHNRTAPGRACVSRRIERLLNECWRRRRRRLGSSKRAPGAPRRLLERRSLGLGAPESLLAAPRAVAVVPNWCDIVLFLIKSRQRQRGGRRPATSARRGRGRRLGFLLHAPGLRRRGRLALRRRRRGFFLRRRRRRRCEFALHRLEEAAVVRELWGGGPRRRGGAIGAGAYVGRGGAGGIGAYCGGGA